MPSFLSIVKIYFPFFKLPKNLPRINKSKVRKQTNVNHQLVYDLVSTTQSHVTSCSLKSLPAENLHGV